MEIQGTVSEKYASSNGKLQSLHLYDTATDVREGTNPKHRRYTKPI